MLALLFLVLLLLSIPAQALSQAGVPPLYADQLFQVAGRTFKVDPELLRAIAAVESRGRPDAVSPKGAQGMMQLMPDTARRFGVQHPFDPTESVLGAARFLSYLREGVEIADLPQLLAAYNAGEGAVEHYGGIPPYPETREYVRRVLLAYFFGGLPSTTGRKPSWSSWRTDQRPLPHAGQPAAVRDGQIAKRTTTDTDVLERLSEIGRARTRALRQQQTGTSWLGRSDGDAPTGK